jgi:glucosylceramidase
MMKVNNLVYSIIFAVILAVIGCWNCSAPKEDPQEPVRVFPVKVCITSADGANLLYQKTLDFSAKKDDRFQVIGVDSTVQYQNVDGFGYTLTGGSAMLLHQLAPAKRAELLQELFGSQTSSVGISYLRISIGASDLDAAVFSYDDLPNNQTDPDLLHFNLSNDTLHLIPVLKEILAIRPDLKIMASPWSPPLWMKTNNSSIGGNLNPVYYANYAQYFVKYIQAMHANGISIDAVTPQNEPQHGGNNPSMVMSWMQQIDFIKSALGPAFATAGLSTKIVIWDHNCDNAAYPINVLDDPSARQFIDGSAFHLYNGDESALSQVHDAYPTKNLYFTEQWTGSTGNFGDDLMWHSKHVVIGTMRNWSRTALEWNLANSPDLTPHTPGGCTQCLGALTIDGQTVSRNVGYYIVAQASKFVPPGSVRLSTNYSGQLIQVAFRTPAGKKVLLVLNDQSTTETFNVSFGAKWIVATLNPRSVGTFVW